jgi:hypothetical protein
MAAKRPTVVVAADGNRKTFSAETWRVNDRGYLALIADDEEIATISPAGWFEVFLIDAEARMPGNT